MDDLISKLIIVDIKLRISWDDYFKNNIFYEGNNEEKSDLYHQYYDYEIKFQPSPNDKKICINIGFIGDCCAGRSVLLHRYFDNDFRIVCSTLGCNIYY